MPAATSSPVVLLVEDNPSMRALIRSLVDDVSSVVYECADGESAVDLYARHHPDWVLMDIALSGLDGIAATHEIRHSDPAARVIIVTEHREEQFRRAASAAGAVGYVLKDHLLDLPRLLTAGSKTGAEGSA